MYHFWLFYWCFYGHFACDFSGFFFLKSRSLFNKSGFDFYYIIHKELKNTGVKILTRVGFDFYNHNSFCLNYFLI